MAACARKTFQECLNSCDCPKPDDPMLEELVKRFQTPRKAKKDK